MTKHLLVGVGQGDEGTEARRGLRLLLGRLRGLGVLTQVAVVDPGPAAVALDDVADVRALARGRTGSVGRKVESATRRVSTRWANRVQDLRTVAGRRALHAPDCIHVHGTRGAPVLRHLRRIDAPVTVYVHPWDVGLAELEPCDRRHLVERADRFLTADDSAVDPLLAAGVDPARIEPIAALETLLPPSDDATTLARTVLGLPTDRPLVAVPPVDDWNDLPDLTVRLAWELERMGRRAAIAWYGMPGDGTESWPIDDDLGRAGISSVHLLRRRLAWTEAVEVADVVVLPSTPSPAVPAGFAETAARRATPLLCWDDHPDAAEVVTWAGTAVARGDVVAMAAAVHAMVVDEAALRRARAASWPLAIEGLERLVPLAIPAP